MRWEGRKPEIGGNIMSLKQNLLVYSVAVILLLGVVGCDALPLTSGEEDGLSASGVVETVDVTIAPEIAGRVVEIYVAEGDSVEEGELLFRLDDEILLSQRQLAVTSLDAAETSLATTQTGLKMAEATLRTAEASVDTVAANAEVELLAAQKALDDLYKAHGVTRSEAARNLAAANRALREAQYRLDNFTVPMNQRDLTTMEAIEVMKAKLDAAREAFEPYKYKESSDDRRKELKEDLDEAQSDYDTAIRRLEYETDMESAQSALNKAMQDLETLKDGPDPNDVAVLEASIVAAETAPSQAEATVEQAQVGLTQAQAQLEQGEKAVAQAQATLNLIDTQMKENQRVSACIRGCIGAQYQPGRGAQPGRLGVDDWAVGGADGYGVYPRKPVWQHQPRRSRRIKGGLVPRGSLRCSGRAHRRPGGVHAAQRPDPGGAQHHGLCHRVGGRGPGGQAQAWHAGGCGFWSMNNPL